MQTGLEPFDPKVGEKRPREDDESDPQMAPMQSPPVKQEPPIGPRVPSGPAIGSVVPNGAMQSNSAMSQGQVMEDGYDSLYIGDLQWVGVSLTFLVVYMLIVSYLFLSGQRTRIYERWPTASACPLTTRISPFRNTR